MEKHAIIIDSACAPTDEMFTRPDMFRMGMNIHLDERTFTDGENLDKEDFYGIVDRQADFSTTPPKVWDVKRIYEEIRRKGYSSLLSIHVSSKMSKLYETCMNASHMVSGLDVHLIDTRNMSIGAGLIGQKVIELARAGVPYEQIDLLLPEIRRSTHLQISLSTLKYIIKNKRVGRVQGFVGSMLKLKPILCLDADGYLATASKERGGERVSRKIVDTSIEFLRNHQHNVKISLTWGKDENKIHVERVCESFMKDFTKLGIKDYTIYKNRMWPTIACNSGPGAYGFAVYGEERPIR